MALEKDTPSVEDLKIKTKLDKSVQSIRHWMKEGNPFTPDYPVSPDLFVGRSDHLSKVQMLLAESAPGAQRYIFVTGERGIGKTSFAGYRIFATTITTTLIRVHNEATILTVYQVRQNEYIVPVPVHFTLNQTVLITI